MSSDRFLSGISALILDAGLGKARARILRQRLKGKGGRVLSSLSPAATHVLVGKNVRRSRLPALLGCTEAPSRVRVLQADWLSACLVAGECVGEKEYELPLESPGSSPCIKKEVSPTVRRVVEAGGTEEGGEEESKSVVKEEEGTTDEATTERGSTEEEEEEEEEERTEGKVQPERVGTYTYTIHC